MPVRPNRPPGAVRRRRGRGGMMKSGSVELRSGTWNWRVEQRERGLLVMYRHRDRPFDEMRTWTYSTEITAAQAREMAQSPPLRKWKDGWGHVWEVSQEVAVPEYRPGADQPYEGERRVRLKFKRGFANYAVLVPAATLLGELTHEELTGLLQRSARRL